MNNNEYNGWTNYATWRVNLEILGDIQFEDKTSADDLKEIVEDVVFSQYDGMNSLMYDYASAFISEVNFYEIAENINEELKMLDRGIVATPREEVLDMFAQANHGTNDFLLMQMAKNYGYKLALENVADEIQAQDGI